VNWYAGGTVAMESTGRDSYGMAKTKSLFGESWCLGVERVNRVAHKGSFDTSSGG
jgi:hypothetical protein